MIRKEPTITSRKMTERKEAKAVYPSSVAGGLLQHAHSFSVQCTVSFDKTVIMTKKSKRGA